MVESIEKHFQVKKLETPELSGSCCMSPSTEQPSNNSAKTSLFTFKSLYFKIKWNVDSTIDRLTWWKTSHLIQARGAKTKSKIDQKIEWWIV